MKITELIQALKKAKAWKHGNITFVLDGKEIKLKTMGQSSFDHTDVTLTFEKVKQ